MITKIVVEIDGKQLELTTEQARELFDELKVIINDCSMKEYVPYPIYPTWPTWPTVTYTTSEWNAEK